MESSTAVAFPGLPVVFAEGYRIVGKRRVSCHSHASFALTSADESVRTKTTVSRAGCGIEFFVDGKPIYGSRAEGMKEIVEEMLSLAGVDWGVRVDSVNEGIVTGSSDSGAAALAVALNHLLGLGLGVGELFDLSRLGSETAYRSLLGGLSECSVDGDCVSASLIKPASGLSGIVAYGIDFNSPRHTADELHARVVGHRDYQTRAQNVADRIRVVKECAADDNLVGLLEVMEADARDVHRMFMEVGLPVIKPEMRGLCTAVESMRSRGVKCFWNVAGGSRVYVFTLRTDAEAVRDELEGLGYIPVELKIAGPSRILEE